MTVLDLNGIGLQEDKIDRGGFLCSEVAWMYVFIHLSLPARIDPTVGSYPFIREEKIGKVWILFNYSTAVIVIVEISIN